MRKSLLIPLFGLVFVLSGILSLYAEKPSQEVEIIIDGEQFGSIIEYKREQIKNILTRALSSQNLHDFSEEDLCEILSDVRTQQTAKKPSDEPTITENQEILSEDPNGLSTDEMEDILEDFSLEHGEVELLDIDPDKVKNIIIKPQD